jgi:hypothetical protein
MGRLDAIINDTIEEQFRMEAIKRFGARKGNLSKALEEAMDLWVKKDALENLKEKAISEHTLMKDRKTIVDSMKSYGMPATVALSEMMRHPMLVSDDIQYITKTINQLRAELS